MIVFDTACKVTFNSNFRLNQMAGVGLCVNFYTFDAAGDFPDRDSSFYKTGR